MEGATDVVGTGGPVVDTADGTQPQAPAQAPTTQQTLFSRLTKQAIQHFIEEVNKEDNNSHIRKQVIDPLIRYSLSRIYPYMLITASLFVLTFCIAIAILVILLKRW